MNIFVLYKKDHYNMCNSSEGAVCGYGDQVQTPLRLEEGHGSADAGEKGFIGDIFCK